MYYDWGWKPYVSVEQRRRQAARKIAALRKKNRAISPIVIQGRAIAQTFWGQGWCSNLERYSDFANRLPRGRTYVRNGSVIDLQIAAGQIKALVSGSQIYTVKVEVAPVTKERWKSICEDCAGTIDSLVELLQGRLSKGIMERICRQETGLFPSPSEIKLSCSCPDWADMCKHVAAVLYGIGARLDQQPELLFRLTQVDEKQLLANAGEAKHLATKGPAAAKVLGGDQDLSALFGLDLQQSTAPGAGLAGNLAAVKSKGTKRDLPPSLSTAPASKSKAGGKKSLPVAQSGERRAGRRAKELDGKMKTKKPNQKMKAWEDARKRHRLSHAQAQMARELGMNPKKLGKIDNHKQEPWKLPLPQFIEELYFKRFGRTAPMSASQPRPEGKGVEDR